MTDDDRRRPEGGSSWHRRVPGFRYISAIAAIVSGGILVVRYLIALGTGAQQTWMLVGGLILLAVGLVSIPVIAWMQKRGL